MLRRQSHAQHRHSRDLPRHAGRPCRGPGREVSRGRRPGRPGLPPRGGRNSTASRRCDRSAVTRFFARNSGRNGPATMTILDRGTCGGAKPSYNGGKFRPRYPQEDGKMAKTEKRGTSKTSAPKTGNKSGGKAAPKTAGKSTSKRS